MSVTRNFLKGMGLSEEQVSAIIEEHTSTISGLKAERDKYKADAEKAGELQKSLDDLQKEDWKAKYEKEHSDYQDYRNKTESEKALEGVKSAYKALLKANQVGEKHIDSIMNVTDFGKMKVVDGKLEGEEELTKTIKSKWSGFIYSEGAKGADVQTPPGTSGGKVLSMSEIYAKDENGRYKLSTQERQNAIAQMQNAK